MIRICCGCLRRWSFVEENQRKAWPSFRPSWTHTRHAATNLVLLGCSVADVSVDTAYRVIDLAASAAVSSDEWGDAAAALNEFVNRVPGHVPALMRLVEICVDGGLEATMYSAQGQLADAYLATGRGGEARVIAEDLVAREPWERANIERFRRALTMLGEIEVDAIIADRLSGQTPFTSTDLSPGLEEDDSGTATLQPEPPPRCPSQELDAVPSGAHICNGPPRRRCPRTPGRARCVRSW